MSLQAYDVLIAGGGVMGSSLAYWLTRYDDKIRVAVIERDPSYEKASTALSMVNARRQFSLRQNVEISQYTFEVFERFEEDMQVDGKKPDIALRREGNLFLIDEESRPDAEKALKMQQDLGCDVYWMTPDDIREKFPLYDPEGYAGGTFSPNDGHFDAYSLLKAYKAKAISQGAEFIKGSVDTINQSDNRRSDNRVTGVTLDTGETYDAGVVVNCTGAWCADLAATVGVKLPIEPVKRQIYALDTEVKPESPLPLTVLASGLFFRSETGGLILLGKSMQEDPVGFDFTVDEDRFIERLWPELLEFVPAFEALKLVSSWAGLYAVNHFDGNAFIGEWPDLKGFYLANGFSGHGLQQAPAVGRYLSELILDLPISMDLSAFAPERLLENKPLVEGGLV